MKIPSECVRARSHEPGAGEPIAEPSRSARQGAPSAETLSRRGTIALPVRLAWEDQPSSNRRTRQLPALELGDQVRRQRVRAAGLQPYELWLKPAEWQAVKRFLERLRARK